MRRILHLRTVTGRGGGPEKTLLCTPAHLGRDYQVRLAYIRPSGDEEYDMPERARRMNVSLIDVPERGPADPRTLVTLHRAIRGFRPDVLHAHDYKTNFLSVLLGKRFRIPVVSTLHGYVTTGTRLGWYYRIDDWSLRRISHLIPVSRDLDERLDAMGIPVERRTLVENGIDTALYRPTETRLKSPPDGPRGGLVVGAAGRLQPEKGFDLLIRAAARLLDEGLDFELVIAGEGPLRGQLAELIERTGHASRIRLLGYRVDMLELYRSWDVFALSSLREGLPNVVLEAMAMQLPTVASRVAGIPRLIEANQNGLLVDPGAFLPLKEALGRLLVDGEMRARLGLAGRRTIEECYGIGDRMRKIRAIYDEVLGHWKQD